eukprot:gene9264-10242_t
MPNGAEKTKQNGDGHKTPSKKFSSFFRNSVKMRHTAFSNVVEAKKLEQRQADLEKQTKHCEALKGREEKELIDWTRRTRQRSIRAAKCSPSEIGLPEIIVSHAEAKRSRLPSFSVQNMDLVMAASSQKAGKHKMYSSIFLPSLARPSPRESIDADIAGPLRWGSTTHNLSPASHRRAAAAEDNRKNRRPHTYGQEQQRSTACPGIVFKSTRSKSTTSEPQQQKFPAHDSTRSDGWRSSNLVVPQMGRHETKQRPAEHNNREANEQPLEILGKSNLGRGLSL